MTTYASYKDAWRTACSRDGLEACIRRYLIVSRRANFVPVKALALAAYEARNGFPLRMTLIQNVHTVCALAHSDPLSLFAQSQWINNPYKCNENDGCKPEDAAWLTADFVHECNSFGTGNPLFYTAYLIGTFCRIAPFQTENLPCALVLATHYLLAHGLAPILFFDDMQSAFEHASKIYMECEDVHPLRKTLMQAAARSKGPLCLERF